MTKDDVLARVELDLSRGHTHLALQRLGTLTATYPDDLAIRARRAAVNRQVGNFAEAGRWGFLSEEVEPAELAAFERERPRSGQRLGALKLPADPPRSLGPSARQRFTELLEQVEREPASDGDSKPENDSESWGEILFLLALLLVFLAIGGFTVFGLISAIRLLF